MAWFEIMWKNNERGTNHICDIEADDESDAEQILLEELWDDGIKDVTIVNVEESD